MRSGWPRGTVLKEPAGQTRSESGARKSRTAAGTTPAASAASRPSASTASAPSTASAATTGPWLPSGDGSFSAAARLATAPASLPYN